MPDHRCSGRSDCPACQAEIDRVEWERDAPEPEPHYPQPDDVKGTHLGYQPDWNYPRDLAPRGS